MQAGVLPPVGSSFSIHAPHRVQPLLQINVEQIVNKYTFKGCQIMNLPRMPTALGLALSLALCSNKDEDSLLHA